MVRPSVNQRVMTKGNTPIQMVNCKHTAHVSAYMLYYEGFSCLIDVNTDDSRLTHTANRQPTMQLLMIVG